MAALLKRLVASSAAYQAASLLSAAIAVVTLPIYTRHVGTGAYGYADLVLVAIILASIAVTFGLTDAIVRWWYDDDDPERRDRLARSVTGAVLASTTALALVALLFAGDISQALLDHRDATLMGFGVLGFWAYANLQVAYALLRAEHRRRAFLIASSADVLLTVAVTLVLVVGFDQGARGLVLGNYGASAVVLVGLWLTSPRHVGLPRWHQLEPLVRFGLPTVPADASVFALNFVDRTWLLHAKGVREASIFSASVKLATAVIVVVRGFQAAWPPLAYSIASDDEARRFYAVVTSAYVGVTGLVVAGMTLLGRWVVRLLTASDFHGAFAALPWLTLGWALYGLYLVFVVIAGRARVTSRNFPAAAAGLAANVVLLALLVGPLGTRGAGIALCGAYAVMLLAIGALTRRLFPVPFEWWRLARIVVVLAGASVAGELLLPTHGAAGFLERAAVLAALPALLALAGAMTPAELRRVRAALTALRPRPARPAG
ncbi:MAG TPA: lipopolysaccharide biosynthesis protein [Solirubrobacteraceae bacterium]|nr:lipopolysaccharide biosynthesis protein [Solirubrobacteraceae bacterium]